MLFAAAGAAGAAAQDGATPRRIGILSPALIEPDPLVDSLRVTLRDLGYVEGRDIVLERRTASSERLPALAAELVRASVAVIVADSTTAARAARAASATVPIVAVVGADPVETGLAESLSRPGGNVTGIAVLTLELAAKRLELLNAALPRAKRVAVFFRVPGTFPHEQLDHAGRVLGFSVEPVQVENSAALRTALRAPGLSAVDAVFVWHDPLFSRHRSEIVLRLAELRKPAIFGEREFVDAGGLLSYGPNMGNAFRRVGFYVDRILRGAKPADLPFERIVKLDLVINLKTARALGIAISPALLARADEVIE